MQIKEDIAVLLSFSHSESTSHINIKIALVIDYIDFKLIFQNNSKNRRNYFFIENSKNGYYFIKKVRYSKLCWM